MGQKSAENNQDQVFRNLQDKLDAAQLHHRAGDLPKAEDYYREILSEDPTNAEAHHLMGLIALQVGRHDIAGQFIGTALELDDSNPVYYANLGATYYSQGESDKAVEMYRRAVELDPEYSDAFLNLGSILKDKENFQEAVEPLDQAVKLRPRDPKAFAQLAEVLITLDHYEEADEIARACANLRPGDPRSLQSLARALIGLGRPREAIPWAQNLTEMEPTQPDHHLLLAAAYTDSGLTEKAVHCARRALYLDPQNKVAYRTLANSLMAKTEWDQALEVADQGLAQNPQSEELVAQKAGILEKKGRYKEAYQLIRPLIDGREQYNVQAFGIFTTLARRYGAAKEAAGMLRQALANKAGLPQGVQCMLYFQAGQLHNDIGEYDRAFYYYQKGNELKPRTYHAQVQENFFQRMQNLFTQDFFQNIPRAAHGSKRPIFIVGMPRSGTSLTEQILASHPSVFGAGELDQIGAVSRSLSRILGSQKPYPECLQDLTAEGAEQAAEMYLDRLAELAPEEADRVTDKMPQNFVHLGLIALLFPQATVIHCRRNPLDTCISCYFQNFVAQGLTFAYNLESLGHYYRLYEQIMQHWHQVLPLSIYDIQYEDVVSDPENQIAGLLDFCGLEWNEACLDFHKNKREVKTASYDQVRRPIYKSSKERWRNYEKHLGPLRQALGMDGVN